MPIQDTESRELRMTNWQVTAATVYRGAVDIDVTIIVYKY